MSRFRELYRVDQLPIFQNYMFHTSEEAKACIKGDLVLVQDMETGLIFNKVFRPELMEYDSRYQNEQAFSPVFRSHLNDVTNIIQRHFAGHSIVEVCCGKGFFLENLQSLGFIIAGIDPTYEGSNPAIIRSCISRGAELQADGIILRHVLEHVHDPIGFLLDLLDSNGGRGKIYIETPCFDWICQHRAWFDIFYEHVNYFRISDFRRIFGRVHEAGHTFGGQYLYVVADIATVHKPRSDDTIRFDFPQDFLATVDRYANKLSTQRICRSAIWGGASKGVIFALFLQRVGARVDLIIDINPAKHGKYLGGTGFKVYSPEEAFAILEPKSDVFVMNSNYLSEIMRLSDYRFNYIRVDHGCI